MGEERYSGLKFQQSNSSFDLDQTEGGGNENKVSAELKNLLTAHEAGDPHTLQILWDMDVWSVADLRNINADQLIHAGMKKFKVTKLKGIVEGKLASGGQTNQGKFTSQGSFSGGRNSVADAKMNRGSFSFELPPAGPPPVGVPATQNDRLTRGSFSFDVPDQGDDRARRSSFASQGGDAPPRLFGQHGSHGGLPQHQRSGSMMSQGYGGAAPPYNQRNSRDSREFSFNGGGGAGGQMDHRFSYMSGPPPPPQGGMMPQRVSSRMSQGSYSYNSGGMPPPQQERPSFLGSGDGSARGSLGGGMTMQRPSVVYEEKDPTTVKGSDATSALDSLNNMWNVLETPDEPGPKKPVFKADPNNKPTANASQGTGGGSGLNVKMVDHSTAPSREVIDKLEEALDGDDSEDQGVEPEDLMRLAHRLIALKQYDAALPYTLRAAKRYERRRGLHDLETMLAVMLAAKLLRRLSHFEKAIEYFALLLDIQEKILGTDHADTANTASALGQLYAATGSPGCELDRAVTCFNQVLHIREKLVEVETSNNGGYLDPTNPTVQIHLSGCAMALHHLGVVHSDLFKYEEALGYFMRALKIRRSLGDIAEKDTASTLNNMAAVLHQLGRNEQCLAVYARSLEIKQKLLPPTHPSIADTLYNMGALNLEMNHPFEASEYFVQALTISTTKLGMHHALTIDLQKQILTCEQLMSQQERHDVNRSRDSMNGFINMNDSFIMATYGGQPPPSNASYSTGSTSYMGGGGMGRTNGSFSNGSFSGVGGIYGGGPGGNRGSVASYNSFNGGGGYGGNQRAKSFASQSSMDSYGDGARQYNEPTVPRKGSGNDDSEKSVLVPPKSPKGGSNGDVSPRSADGGGGPVRKRTGSSDGSVDSRRSLGGEGVSVQAPPMTAISHLGD